MVVTLTFVVSSVPYHIMDTYGRMGKQFLDLLKDVAANTIIRWWRNRVPKAERVKKITPAVFQKLVRDWAENAVDWDVE